MVNELEHSNTYPEKLIEQMNDIGIFGLVVPEPWGPGRVSTACFARVTEELARGWVSLAGAMSSHSVIAHLNSLFGRNSRRTGTCRRWQPARCDRPWRSPRPAVVRICRRCGRWLGPTGTDDLIIDGAKMWITNARRAGVIGLLCKTDPDAQPRTTASPSSLPSRKTGSASRATGCHEGARRLRVLTGVRDRARLYREAPLFLVGEGTNEMQRQVNARQLVDRGGLAIS